MFKGKHSVGTATVNWTFLHWHEAINVLVAIFASQNEKFLKHYEDEVGVRVYL